VSEPRPILHFSGGLELVGFRAPWVTVYGADAKPRVRVFAPGCIDVATVGAEIWIADGARLLRIARADGGLIADDECPLDPGGHFLISPSSVAVAVWHAATPAVISAPPLVVQRPEPAGSVILPVSPQRRLVWAAGALRSWRGGVEIWRRPVGDAAWTAIDMQLVLDGRLVVLVQRDPARPDELRLAVAAAFDGDLVCAIRVADANYIAIAADRGLAVVQHRKRLSCFDLRTGRVIETWGAPAGAALAAVDPMLDQLALSAVGGLHLVRPIDLVAYGVAVAAAAAFQANVQEPIVVAPDQEDAVEELPDESLAALLPITATATASPAEIQAVLERELLVLGARIHVAIARAWDTGQIRRPDQQRLPYLAQIEGILGIKDGHAPGDLAAARARLSQLETFAAERRRDQPSLLLPSDVLARDLGLSPFASQLLLAIAGPSLRGDLARLYGILANNFRRPLVDELLLAQIFGDATAVALELDGAAPLRASGLVTMDATERPFAKLSADRIGVRVLAGLPDSGEPRPHARVRTADRDIAELQLPGPLVARALRVLAAEPTRPTRIVVRGRAGSGRHTLLAALAARAGRALEIIDLAMMPRAAVLLASSLEDALRRARLVGHLPCLDGLELTGADDPDATQRLEEILRSYRGPLAIRLPAEARVPLDPGYLLLDLPVRNEHQRGESWTIAASRYGLALPDASELAARYRIGPGIIERVCAEVSRRPEQPATPAAAAQELDDTVRQHLENRLGATAQRVRRLATWADIVLPPDLTDALLEMTSRVRHRKKVYEQWGFDRTITTARGITALFQGSPGTGKTMVAGVIARDLGLELYRVDVSQITSKWVGETEKNLGSLFDAAEDGQVMLLFDEADSLFAKRTDVKTSVDKYSNMEVNYLLQRLDTFEGVAILTTNFGNSIDPAFKRRLTYRITFPFPDDTMREQLWRTLLPAQVPVRGELDFAGLARRFKLSGGYIRNVALRAAFLAAEEAGDLTQEHFERAIRMEYREIGKLATGGNLE
jgi:hypothetical protein